VASLKTDLAELPRPEAVFLIDGTTDLYPRDGDDAARDYLARRIASRPGDLLSHTRRIMLSHRRLDAAEAYAALVDLFIATGRRGKALKERLVRLCSPLFTPPQRQFLDKHCADGLTGDLDIDPPVARTMLTRAAGSGKIVVRR